MEVVVLPRADAVRRYIKAVGDWDHFHSMVWNAAYYTGTRSSSSRRFAMRVKAAISTVAVVILGLTLPRAAAGQVPAGVGEGWNGEFDHAARQITLLAEAIPAEKYSWRPGTGVRSVSEVIMHVAVANHFLLGQAGMKPAVDLAKLGKEPEKSITAKSEVIQFLKASFDAVRKAVSTLDRSQRAKLFGKDVTIDGIFQRLLVHNHEHMGQLIAYARMNEIVPPWSASGGN